MNSNDMNDSLRLQLLVDGQLGHTLRSQWLDSIQNDSEQWRQIALGFIENQILNEALAQADGLLPESGTTKPVSVRKQLVPRSRTTGFWWLAIAASLLLGMMFGTKFPGRSDQVETAVVIESTRAGDSMPNAPASANGGEQVLNLPLADALARSFTPVSLNARRAFLKAGYFVDETQQIATVELPTGTSIQMPIRQVTVRYLGQNAYQ